jgi:hypothetical protein
MQPPIPALSIAPAGFAALWRTAHPLWPLLLHAQSQSASRALDFSAHRLQEFSMLPCTADVLRCALRL